MTTDYAQISKENTRRYGTDIDVYGSTLLANLYSDRTHFLYELIQNAEDAGATHIEFRLFSDRLEIRHNGRVFTREDVRSICGLVDSTKKDDLTQIGKFGIGFKSVYAYTDAPHVYSRDEAFRIRNYVHPEAVEPVALSEEETLFLLPFDHKAVAAHMAFAEIASRLQNLGLRTLLFLRHISEIRWIIEGADDGNYICNSKAIGAQARFVHILSRVQDQEQQEEWIVFARPVGGSVESGLRVEIAYQMDVAAEAAENRLIQTRDATLVAFFETDKETRLHFLMQGPYRTTPARDNIPGHDSWNKDLIQETAILVSDSIVEMKMGVEMKRMGLLNVDFLSILPISESDFPAGSMFRPIYNAVRKRLKGTEDLLPTADGGYTNARQAYLARGRDLIDLLDPDHLRRLFGRQGKWLDVGITADRTPALRSYLISELGIAEVDPERFARQVDEKFMVAQDDIWVARFYKYLLNHTALLRKPQTRSGSWDRRIVTQEGGTLSQAPIIRLSDDTHVPVFTKDGEPSAYLPGEFGDTYQTIKRSIFEDEGAKSLLLSIGFKIFDVYAEIIEHILPKYRQTDLYVEYNEGLEDNRKIVQALRSVAKSKRDGLIRELADLPFLVAESRSAAEQQFYSPSRPIYIGSKYTGNQQIENFLKRIGVAGDVVWLDERYAGIYDSVLLTEIGCIGSLDILDELERHVLPKYSAECVDVSNDETLRDAIEITSALRRNAPSSRQTRFEKTLKDKPFLRGINTKTGAFQWAKPKNIYLGSIYTGEQDIERYLDGNPDALLLANFYHGRISLDQLVYLGCLQEIRVQYQKPEHGDHVPIVDRHGWHERGLDGFDPDFWIEGLEHALNRITSEGCVQTARVLWKILRPYRQAIFGIVEKSTKQDFTGNSKQEQQASKAGQLLRDSRWLPDRSGRLHAPSDICLSQLHDSFDTKSSDARELAVKLGCQPGVDLDQFAPKERERIEFALTITEEEIKDIKKIRAERIADISERKDEEGFSFPDEVRRAFEQPQTGGPLSPEQVPGPMPNSERRRKRTRQQIEETQEAEPPAEERFRRVPAKIWESKNNHVRAFLKEQYRGRCQVCGYSFIKRDGEPYFEGLYLVSRTMARWVDRPGNVLCLCANCCAKFRFGEVETEGNIVEHIRNAKPINKRSSGSLGVKIKLCGIEMELKFQERHILDLQEMLELI